MSVTVHALIDSFTDQTRANWNGGQAQFLKTGTNMRTYLNFPITPPPRSTLLNAVLRMTAFDAWASKTIVITPILTKWTENGVTYNNRPTLDTPAAKTISGITLAVGEQTSFSVTNLIAPYVGNPWFGLSIQGGNQFASSEHYKSAWRPLLELTWSPTPVKPSNLIPDEGFAVSDPSPILTWEWSQAKLEMAQFQVQISAVPDFSTIAHDSGWVTSDDARYNLTGKHTLTAGLRYWRVRIQTAFSTISNWSATAQFKYIALPTLTVAAPASIQGDTDSPLVNWTFAGQRSARVIVVKPNKDIAHGSDNLGTVTSYEIPEGTKKHPVIRYTGRQYIIKVRAWDNVDRVATPGNPTYAEVEKPYTWRETGSAVPAPDQIQFASAGVEYKVKVQFHRTLVPDRFMLQVEGERFADIDAGSIAAPGLGTGWYEWIRDDIPALSTVKVRAGVVQADGHIDWSNPIQGVPQVTPTGAWLWCAETNEALHVFSQEQDLQFQIEDDSTEYRPIGRPDPVVLSSVVYGYTGIVNGLIQTAAQKRILDNMIGYHDDKEIRVIAVDKNMLVRLGVVMVQPTIPPFNFIVSIPVTQIDGPWPDQQ